CRIRRSSRCARERSWSTRRSTCRSSSTGSRSGRRRPASRSSPARCASVSRRSAAFLAAVFATLAALVAAGAFTRLDQWSIDHLMPGGSFRHKPESLINGLVPLLHAGWGSGYAIAVDIVTLPASFVIALVTVALCSRALGLALIAAVGVEVICKELLTRPALYDGSFHIAAFDSAFPSGHAL